MQFYDFALLSIAYFLDQEGAYRLPETEAPLPKIPVQPIGYDEAEVLLRWV